MPAWRGQWYTDIGIKTEIVDANIPLLLGGAALERMGAILDFQKMKLKFPISKESDEYRLVDIQKESSGHYSFEIKLETDPKQEAERMIKNENLARATLLVQISEEWTEKDCSVVTLLIASDQGVTKDNIEKRRKQAEEELVGEISKKDMFKLHHYFGHCHPKKLKDLIQRAGRWGVNSQTYLKEIEKCEVCLVHSSKISKPKIALPRSTRVNEVVTIDLRKSRCEKAGAWILYMIGSFSRFKMGYFIPNKLSTTVVNKIITTWIRILGPMTRVVNF